MTSGWTPDWIPEKAARLPEAIIRSEAAYHFIKLNGSDNSILTAA